MIEGGPPFLCLSLSLSRARILKMVGSNCLSLAGDRTHDLSNVLQHYDIGVTAGTQRSIYSNGPTTHALPQHVMSIRMATRGAYQQEVSVPCWDVSYAREMW